MRDTGYQPPPRRDAQAPARGGVGERIASAAGDLAKAGANRAGHAALDLTITAARGAAHHPAEFMPVAAAGTLFAAGDIATTTPALGWPLLYTALALAGYLLHRRPESGARGVLRRAYYALAFTAALTWVTTAAILSPTDPLALEILGAATAAASAGWWARHLRRAERATPELVLSDEEAELAALRAEITAWWAERGSPDRGFAPGSSVLDATVDDIAYRLDVQLDNKKQVYDDLATTAAHKRIAGTRGTSRHMILVERWPDQREDRAKITVFRKYLLQENVPYPGPSIDMETGCTTVGRCADGTPALLRLWEPRSGTWHEMVAGTSGAGKSRYIDQALIGERHCLDADGRHLVVSWICDPQEGQSLPDWQERVDQYARNPLESLALLERAYVEMLARNHHLANLRWTDSNGNARRGRSYFEPTGDMPILSITIEEAPNMLALPRFRWLVEQFLKMGRKCGIRLRLVAQIPSIAELGSSFTIRPLLASMCVVCLRTSEPISAGAFTDLPGDPRDLPKRFPDGTATFGLGYIVGASEPALFRTYALDDVVVYEWANKGTTARFKPLAVTDAPAATVHDAPGSAPTDASGTNETPDRAILGEAAAVGSARELIRAYLTQHPGHVTSGALVHALGLNNSTVSQALARDVAAGKIQRITHGVYAAVGTDPGLWRDERAGMAA